MPRACRTSPGSAPWPGREERARRPAGGKGDTMPISQDTLRMLRTEPDGAGLGLEWLNPGTEWGVRAEPGRKGLTLDEINKSSYGEVPEVSYNFTGRPRGGAARPEAPRLGNR